MKNRRTDNNGTETTHRHRNTQTHKNTQHEQSRAEPKHQHQVALLYYGTANCTPENIYFYQLSTCTSKQFETQHRNIFKLTHFWSEKKKKTNF